MLTREQLSRNLGTNLERERFKLGYSQQDMAKALDMSLSSYKRLANGDTGKVDVYTVYKLSQLTGKMFYELCGESSDLFQTYDRMRNLSPTQLHFIESLVQFEFDFARNLETVPSVSREDYTTMIIPSGNMHDGMVYDSCSLEKINISAMTVFVTERTQELFHRYPVNLDAMAVEKLDENVRLVEQNGVYKITDQVQAGEPTYLTVSGQLQIAKGAEKALESYVKIVVNGKAVYPKSIEKALVGKLTCNGC